MRQPRVPRFSKKELAVVLGLCAPRGRVYYERLRAEVFTDDFLSAVGLTPEMYAGKCIWPFAVRQNIMVALQLTADDFRPD